MPPLSAQHAPTVLCIDDQEEGVSIRKIFLETFGYRVLTASSGAEGLHLAAAHAVHVVLLDYRMPEMDGEEVARRLRGQHPALPILMLTGFAQELSAAVHTLVDGVITKGTAPAEVLKELRRVLGCEPERPSGSVSARVPDHVEVVRQQVQRSREHAEQVRIRRPPRPL